MRVTVVVVTLAVVAIVLYRAARLGWSAWSTYLTAATLSSQVTAPSSLAALPELQVGLQRLAADLDSLQGELRAVAPVLAWAGALPEVGPALAAAPDLVAVGRQAVALGQELLSLLGPALADAEGAGAMADTADPLLAALAQAGPELPTLVPAIGDLRAAVGELPAADLPPRLAESVSQAGAVLALADVGARLGPQLAWLLGMDAPRTYLILVQNNHELRATGGFVSAAGTIRVDKGRVISSDFVDSYAYFRDDRQYPRAPKPMEKYMGIQLMLLRDANWSPDLPTAAQVARALYTQETGIQVDGIVTVDSQALKHVVAGLGKLAVPGLRTPLTAENLEEQAISLWEQPAGAATPGGAEAALDWWSRRKDFIPAIAAAALARLQRGDFDGVQLAAAVQAAFQDRSLQLWVADEDAGRVLAEAGWDGGLHPAPGADFLAVVDTNMGYNKVDAAMERALAYTVDWPAGAGAPALATLTLTYTHPIRADDPGCDPTPRYGATYADLMARCYFDYVRVYAPRGSKLIDVAGVAPEDVTTQPGERGTQQFAGYFVLPPGSTQRVTFTYELPAGIAPESYRLVLQRQAGTDPLPVHLAVDGMSWTGAVTEGRLEWPPPLPAPEASGGPPGAPSDEES